MDTHYENEKGDLIPRPPKSCYRNYYISWEMKYHPYNISSARKLQRVEGTLPNGEMGSYYVLVDRSERLAIDDVPSDQKENKTTTSIGHRTITDSFGLLGLSRDEYSFEKKYYSMEEKREEKEETTETPEDSFLKTLGTLDNPVIDTTVEEFYEFIASAPYDICQRVRQANLLKNRIYEIMAEHQITEDLDDERVVGKCKLDLTLSTSVMTVTFVPTPKIRKEWT